MFHPESKMMSAGYNPADFEGSLKAPIFQTSTFTLKSCEEAKEDFEIAFGVKDPVPGKKMENIYSRLANPNLRILEKRLAILENSDDAAVFSSGMAAISTILHQYLKPGDTILHSAPLYGGTYHYINEILEKWGIHTQSIEPDDDAEDIFLKVKNGEMQEVAMIYLETPANPTNTLYSIEEASKAAERLGETGRQPVVVVDNTYMGPIWQKPMEFGADLVVYSATKFLGGHSDLIAGAVMGNAEMIHDIKTLRTFMGNMADAWTCWLIMRSLETLELRMHRQCQNAMRVAEWLNTQEIVDEVLFPSMFRPIMDKQQFDIYQKQCHAPGAVLSFRIQGGEKEAFKFLDNLKMIKLAVSLGSTESLAEHPNTMTHLDLFEDREKYGVTPNLVRLSIGVENIEDIITDVANALEVVAETAVEA